MGQEAVGGGREIGGGGGQERALEVGGAKGLAKEASPIMELRFRASKEGKGLVEVLGIRGGERGVLKGGRSGEDFLLGGVEVNAVSGAFLDESSDVERRVGKGEAAEGIINVAGAGCLGTKPITIPMWLARR
jgi:hypothetical protein